MLKHLALPEETVVALKIYAICIPESEIKIWQIIGRFRKEIAIETGKKMEKRGSGRGGKGYSKPNLRDNSCMLNYIQVIMFFCETYLINLERFTGTWIVSENPVSGWRKFINLLSMTTYLHTSWNFLFEIQNVCLNFLIFKYIQQCFEHRSFVLLIAIVRNNFLQKWNYLVISFLSLKWTWCLYYNTI